MTVLEKTLSEKDLGVIDRGLMRKTFRFFDKMLFKLLYPTFIRPHLEFASSAWNKLNEGDIEKIETVQRRATSMVFETRSMNYSERLKEL